MLEAVSQSRLLRLDRSLHAYRLAHGAMPKTLEDLVAASLVDRSYLKDPWARPYHYALTQEGYLLSAVDAFVSERLSRPDREVTLRTGLLPQRRHGASPAISAAISIAW